MSEFIVGLTGGIGSGKTAVSDYFSALGVAVVDADVCARLVVEPARPALAQIAEHFGDAVMQADGYLNRAALRAIVFKDRVARRWLEKLLHPLIFEEIRAQLQGATSTYTLLVSPLLVEAGQNTLCQRILVVDAPETAQIERSMVRDGNSAEQIKAIMATQAAREERLAHADDVISNDGDMQTLKDKVSTLHLFYLQLSHCSLQA